MHQEIQETKLIHFPAREKTEKIGTMDPENDASPLRSKSQLKVGWIDVWLGPSGKVKLNNASSYMLYMLVYLSQLALTC